MTVQTLVDILNEKFPDQRFVGDNTIIADSLDSYNYAIRISHKVSPIGCSVYIKINYENYKVETVKTGYYDYNSKCNKPFRDYITTLLKLENL